MEIRINDHIKAKMAEIDRILNRGDVQWHGQATIRQLALDFLLKYPDLTEEDWDFYKEVIITDP